MTSSIIKNSLPNNTFSMKEITIGQKAPKFTLPESSWKSVSLSDFKGKKDIILYFYPKDDTPGCTKEACSFRDNTAKLDMANAIVLGISRDNLKSHEKFKDKYELPFTLLSDAEGKVCELYGCLVKKSMFGKEYLGLERSTFLIDKEGVVRKIWRKVKVDGHSEEILEALNSL